jgi:hypothetical protein
MAKEFEMNKEQVLKSLPTFKLLAWEETAETSGNGKYVYFDSRSSGTRIFTIESIRAELDKRDDVPNREPRKKKKK